MRLFLKYPDPVFMMLILSAARGRFDGLDAINSCKMTMSNP